MASLHSAQKAIALCTPADGIRNPQPWPGAARFSFHRFCKTIRRMFLQKKKPVTVRCSRKGAQPFIGSIMLPNHQNDSFSTMYNHVL